MCKNNCNCSNGYGCKTNGQCKCNKGACGCGCKHDHNSDAPVIAANDSSTLVNINILNPEVEEVDIKAMPFIFDSNGNHHQRIPVGGEGDWFDYGEPCSDCGAKQGQYHDDGCDCERCPVCGLQMLCCDCWECYGTIETNAKEE